MSDPSWRPGGWTTLTGLNEGLRRGASRGVSRLCVWEYERSTRA